MGYDDSYYYGQNKLICTAKSSADEGKAVSVVSMSGRSWSGTITDGVCTFLLPPRDAYTITLMNGDDIQHSVIETLGFGECKIVDIGLDKNTPEGIRAILNAGCEDEYFKVGDQVLVSEGGANVPYDILHINYTGGKNANGHNIVFGRHFFLNEAKKYNLTQTNTGGFLSSYINDYLNGSFFDSLSLSWRNAIEAGGLPFAFMGGIGASKTAVQETPCKIFLPTAYNVDGVGSQTTASERTDANGSIQFSMFADSSKRIKTHANGTVNAWWTASPNTASSGALIISSAGATDTRTTDNAFGIVPCFILRSDN